MKTICLFGGQNSGKQHVLKYIKEHVLLSDKKVEIYDLSDVYRKIVNELFLFDKEVLIDKFDEFWNITPREAMRGMSDVIDNDQLITNNYKYNIRRFEKWVQNKSTIDYLIVNNLRFPEELVYFKNEFKATIIHVWNPIQTLKCTHGTEIYIEDMTSFRDYLISNDEYATKIPLKEKVDYVLCKIIKK